MDRKLASIQRITKLDPIEGADRILRASILGWKVIVKKDDFKEGDLCVFFEVDSILPFNPWNDFLRDKNRPEKPIRLKTVKMKRQISEGLAMPLNILEGLQVATEEGTDLTEVLGVQKFEEYVISNPTEVKGNFPVFLKKTDETRIQSIAYILDRYKGLTFVAREKADGESTTIYNYNDAFGVCSRNLDLKDLEGNKYWSVVRKYNLQSDLPLFAHNRAIQGELVGPYHAHNRLELKERDFYIFSVYDIEQRNYCIDDAVNETAHIFKMKICPKFYEFTLDHTVDQLVEMSTVRSKINPEVWAEGLVFRPATKTIEDPDIGRLSFKVINPEYKLKHGL
jgi:RNA ligase (TIGR02306 family)